MDPLITTLVRERIGDKVCITPRGKRRIWTAEFHFAGKHCHRSLKTTNLKIARQRAMALEVELVAGGYAAPRKPISLAKTIEEFIVTKKGEGRAHKTIVKYQSELNAFCDFQTRNGAHLLQQITPTLFEEYRAAYNENHAPKTTHVALMILKSLMKWAVLRELVAKNPLLSCKVIEPYAAPKLAPTLPDVNRLIEAAEGVRKTQIALLAFTGLRAGEARMLRPQDVDLQHGWIRIVGREGWIPKTRQARKIPIHPRLSAILGTMPKTSRPYFFCAAPSPKYPEGGHVISTKRLNEDFQKLAASLGLPIGRKREGLVIHSLRHFFETVGVNSGVPQFVVDAWMGHSSQSAMGRLYYGLTDEQSQAFIRQMKF
jgi:integrase